MIPAKEKARELIDKFEPYVIRYTQDDVVGYLDQETPILEYQKQCALIAVDEILKYVAKFEYGQGEKTTTYTYDYLQEVKLEIEKI